jgi:4'-phosphopantetheinyl transferase
MLQLHSEGIALWLAFCDEIADEGLLMDYRRLLVEEERYKEGRFHFARDRHRYLITRALVRTVLSLYAEIAPQDWRFVEDAHGRPRIVNEDPDAQRISFNVSHTRSLVVLGVTSGRALGVDTEDIQARRAAMDLVAHYFAAEEVAQLRATPPDLLQPRFFEYWTLKESYIKARGLGLSMHLGQFAFDLSQERAVRVHFHPPLLDDPARWVFWLLRADANHYVTICAERAASEVPRLTFTKIVPLRDQAPFHCEELRSSEFKAPPPPRV